MASLGDELSCPICLELYTEPVSLRCGHNFCRSCIMAALDTQEEARVYSCPKCREEYAERPQLEKNRKLNNIVESFRSTHQNKIFCTYCVDSPVPALKTCLQCEISMCERHLLAHDKLVNHIVTELTSSLEYRKCSVHKETLKYYCPADGASICMSCWVAGDHKGHQVELLDDAAEKKKETLRDAAEKLKSQRQETERRIQNLESHRTAEKGKATDFSRRVTELFSGIRRQLDELEKNVLSEILRHQEQILQSAYDLSQHLERQKDELSGKIIQMEELCDTKDPLTVLKNELDSNDIISKIGDITSDVIDAGCLDEEMISKMLHSELLHFTDSLTDIRIKRVMEKSDITLDIDTAPNYIIVSKDLRSASYSSTNLNRPDGPLRFKSKQVLSTQSFSSGRHYWEVDVSGAEQWLVGVAAHSIERKIAGNESYIGYNEKSWSLVNITKFRVYHNNKFKELHSDSPLTLVGVYLEYEAGRLSFYQLCDSIRHLHTFTTTFTEPLHAAFYVFPKASIRATDRLYCCPECRKGHPEQPLLNTDTMAQCQTTETKQEKAEIFCTYCVHASVPASKTCLQCETSMCEKHLLAHNKSVDHVLTEPTASFVDIKCSAHKEMLKYYCPEDDACICMSCWVAGDHKGHQVELLNEAAEKKKETLREATEKLNVKSQDAEKKIQTLENYRSAEKGKVAAVTERVDNLFSDFRRHLDDIEKNIRTELSRQEGQILKSVSDVVRQLSDQKDKISQKNHQIKQLCDIQDPVTVLRKDFGAYTVQKAEEVKHDIREAERLDEVIISLMLHKGLLCCINSLADLKPKGQFPLMEKSVITLDINTAHNNIIVSEDLRTLTFSSVCQKRRDGPQRFKNTTQVLSTQSFSSGRHYWEVNVGAAKEWLVGVAAHTIDRKTESNTRLRCCGKLWSVYFSKNLGVGHNFVYKNLTKGSPVVGVGIYLDYEAGRVSFYQLGDPIRHLHTFTATFTEPLHASFSVAEDSSIKIC
ncbi:E3 ubiquitin/ISG15 ligase TRIM25-like [Gastrophryne carolinensis]